MSLYSILRSGGKKNFYIKNLLSEECKIMFLFFIYFCKNEFKSSCPIYQIPLQKLRGGNLCKYMKMYFFSKREKPDMQICNLSAQSSIIHSYKKNWHWQLEPMKKSQTEIENKNEENYTLCFCNYCVFSTSINCLVSISILLCY